MKGNTMFDGAMGATMAVGLFVLLIALVYAVLQIRRRNLIERERDRESGGLYADARAQRDNLKYQAGVGRKAARPHSPRPNDIT
jgi:hypothetical protein